MDTGVRLMIVVVVRIHDYLSLLEVATCLPDGVWPETLPSTSGLALPCVTGYSGTMYRDCSVQGEWSEVDDSLCSWYMVLLVMNSS